MIIFSVANIFMNRPATGVVVRPSLEDSPRAKEVAKTNTITAKHFKLVYDAGLDTVSNISEGDKTALEVYRVARSDTTGRRTFVITIKPLPAGGMSEESSYKLRRINPATYLEGSIQSAGQSYVTFEKADKTELTAFAAHKDKLAVLAYTLDTPEGDLHKEAGALLDTFSWLD